MAAYDGAFVGWFGRFNAQLGTPVRVNVMSGIVSTIFMIGAVNTSQRLERGSTFIVVLYLATSTTLLSYILIFPAAIKLRYSHPHVAAAVPRAVRHGRRSWARGVLCTGLDRCSGSWAAVFPGTIDEYVFGLDYSVHDNYGVSRARFEVFTLGTLGVVLAIGGDRVRPRQAGARPRRSICRSGRSTRWRRD